MDSHMFRSLSSRLVKGLTPLVLLGGLIIGGNLIGAEGPIPTQDVVNQHIGQSNTEGLTETVYDANTGEQMLALTAAQLASQAAGTTPQTDPDPQVAVEITEIVTNEDVVTPQDTVYETAYNDVMESLEVPQVVQPSPSLPETVEDYTSDGCPAGFYGVLCRLFN